MSDDELQTLPQTELLTSKLEETENAILPTLYEVQLALHSHISDFKGGIKGVWEAIDPRFKELDKNASITNKSKSKGIKESAFRKQVSRLKKKPENEKMTFGIRGNILLLLNVFDVLGIHTISDLLGQDFQKPNIEAIIHDTNIKTDEIQNKLDEILENLEISMKRNPRFSAFKVGGDLENILIDLNDMINNKPSINEQFNVIKTFLERTTRSVRISLKVYDILTKYREYFIQDRLLHRYCKILGNSSINDHNTKIELFNLSPLYVFYFFCIVHRKYLLSIIQYNQKNKSGGLFTPFEYRCYDEYRNKVENNRVNSITKGDIGTFILSQNNNMMNYTKEIIQLAEETETSNEQSEEYFELMKEAILLFLDIYSNHVDILEDELVRIMEKIKSINDLYSILTLGKHYVFLISEDHINKLIIINNKLESMKDIIQRVDD